MSATTRRTRGTRGTRALHLLRAVGGVALLLATTTPIVGAQNQEQVIFRETCRTGARFSCAEVAMVQPPRSSILFQIRLHSKLDAQSPECRASLDVRPDSMAYLIDRLVKTLQRTDAALKRGAKSQQFSVQTFTIRNQRLTIAGVDEAGDTGTIAVDGGGCAALWGGAAGQKHFSEFLEAISDALNKLTKGQGDAFDLRS